MYTRVIQPRPLCSVLLKVIYIIGKVRSYTLYTINSLILPKSYHPNSPGYDYGARGGKTLSVFVEDLNLPQADMYGVQEVNEVMKTLRELVVGNGHVLCIDA